MNEINYTKSNYKRFSELNKGDILYCFCLDDVCDIKYFEIPVEEIIDEKQYYIIAYNDEKIGMIYYNNRSDFDKERNSNSVFLYFPSYKDIFKEHPTRYWRGLFAFNKETTCIKLFDFTNADNKNPIFVFTTVEERNILLKALALKYIKKYQSEIELNYTRIDYLSKFI